ncbi:alcohol dehydrogenase catalytic domain-containing protein [bacterium]|nr:alcohol dehydrogenase catalytic domain-containing protein [bacterium]
MKALIWEEKGKIKLTDKEKPQITAQSDAIIKVTLSSICTSDLHIINEAVPLAKPNIVLGHEFVGEVVEIGSGIKNFKIGDRISANCITFCGKCYYCKKGFINNCQEGGWELGCKIDGCQAEFVKVPFADTCLTKLPDNVSYENALFVGDILSSGYFGAELCNIKENDTVAIIGSGPVGLCAMQCAKLFGAKNIIAIDIDPKRLEIAKNLNLATKIIEFKNQYIENSILNLTNDRGADCVIEAAGTEESFELAWKIARPNATVAIVAIYEQPQILPLNKMYGKNLTFKTGGVDAIHCAKLVKLISENKLNTDFLISKKFPLNKIEEAYEYFKNKKDNCLKVAITPFEY